MKLCTSSRPSLRAARGERRGARAATRLRAAVGDVVGDGGRLDGEFLVRPPANASVGIVSVAQLRCQPSLRARTREAQRVGESRGVSASRRALERIGRQRREHLATKPLVEEGVGADRSRSAWRVLRRSRRRCSRSSTSTMPRVAPSSTSASTSFGVAKSEVQRHAGAEGVAAEDKGLHWAGRRRGVARSRRVTPELRVLAVSGQVKSQNLVGSCQNGTKLMCRVLGLRETVQPHEEWARAATLDTEE